MVRGSEKLRVEFEKNSFIQRSSEDFTFRPYTDYELKELRSKLISKASKENGRKRELLMKIANDLAILLQENF